jgi:hypothetical protein
VAEQKKELSRDGTGGLTMRMIEADKVIPLVRLLLLFHPNAERIVEDMQQVVDHHTIEAEPVRHSNWKYYRKDGKAVCLNCSFERNLDDDFGRAVACPNCGAKMDVTDIYVGNKGGDDHE